MTCGINLGFLLVCFLQALNFCCSWTSHQGEGFRTHGAHLPFALSSVHGRFGDSRPQDKFRQAYVAKGTLDTRAKQVHYSEQHIAPQARRRPSVQFNPSSLAKPRWHNIVSSFGNIPPKQAFGLSSAAVGDSRAFVGIRKTSPGQLGGQHTGQYVPRKPDFQGPKGTAHQPGTWKPHGRGKVSHKPGLSGQLPGLDGKGGFVPPKEYSKPTSGLSRGRKVYLKDASTKRSPLNSLNPVVSNIRERYERPVSHYFGLQAPQMAAYNQNPQLVSLQTGLGPVRVHSESVGPDEEFVVHHIPFQYGGAPIQRLGEEESMAETTITKKFVSPQPTKAFTYRPLTKEPYRPQPLKVHRKSKWLRIKSSHLKGSLGAIDRTL